MCRQLDPNEIRNNSLVLHTIQAGRPQCVFDEATQEWRVSSGAFSPSRDGYMSCDLEQLLTDEGRDVDALFPNMPRAVGLVAHEVSEYRNRQLSVDHQPLAENYYHGGVGGRWTKAIARYLSKNYRTIVEIDQEKAAALAGTGG